MVTRRQTVNVNEQGVDMRFLLSNNDELEIDLRKTNGSTWGIGSGLTWEVRPGSGATISIKYSVGADFADANFVDHNVGDIVADRGYLEQAKIQGLRFTTSGGTAIVTVACDEAFEWRDK